MKYKLNSKIRVYCQILKNGIPINNLVVKLKIRRNSDGFYFDFSDNTFKETGHVLIENTILNIGNGIYEYILDTNNLLSDIYFGEFSFVYDDEQRFILSEDYTDDTIEKTNENIQNNNDLVAEKVWNYTIE